MTEFQGGISWGPKERAVMMLENLSVSLLQVVGVAIPTRLLVVDRFD